MITDRQRKHLLKMYILRKTRLNETDEEMRAIYLACLDVSNKNFGDTMRILIKKLEDLEKIQNGLSPKVKKILIDLKEDYEF